MRIYMEQNSELPEERLDLPWFAPDNLVWLRSHFAANFVFTRARFAMNDVNSPDIVAVTGPETAFGDGLDAPVHVPDDTIVLLESPNTSVYWTEPGDFDVRDSRTHVPPPPDPDGFHVAFADGEVWYLRNDVPQTTLRPFFVVSEAAQHDRVNELLPYCLRRIPSRSIRRRTVARDLRPRRPVRSAIVGRTARSHIDNGRPPVVLGRDGPAMLQAMDGYGDGDYDEDMATVRELYGVGAEGDIYVSKPQYIRMTFGSKWHGEPEQLDLLRRFPYAKEIHLAGINIDDEALEVLASVPGIHALSIHKTRVTPQGLCSLRDARDILSLSLSGCELSPEICDVIGHMPLRRLELMIEGDLPRHAITAFDSLHGLVSFTFRSTTDAPTAVAACGHLQGLRHLDLSDTRIDDSDLEHVASMPCLTDIRLSRTRVTGTGLQWLATIPRLRSVWLDGLLLDDVSWSHMAKLRKLESLSLVGTNATDASLSMLADLHNLRTVDLRETDVTKMGLTQLRNLPYLLTVRDSERDTVVFCDDWLNENEGQVCNGLHDAAKKEGGRVLSFRSGQLVEIPSPLASRE